MRICLFFLITVFLMGCSSTESQRQEPENQTLETILNRKSVRKYKDRPVEKEKIDKLIRAGMAAPSSRDRRPWEFIIVTDWKALDTMAEGLPFARMLKETRQAIVVCGDTIKSSNAWFLDCSAASQNLLLAAESMGLGAVSGPDRDRPERASATGSYHAVERHTCGIPHAERDSQKQIQRPTDPSQWLVKLYDFQITPSVSRPVHPNLHGNTFRHFLYVRDNADLAPLRTQALQGIHSDPQCLRIQRAEALIDKQALNLHPVRGERGQA